MFCPHCGIKIELDDQHYCHSCGFDLSKVNESQPTEREEMIDIALRDQSKPAPSPALEDDSQKDEQAIAMTVKCPYCAEEIGLNQSEWSTKGFTCPSCNMPVDLNKTAQDVISEKRELNAPAKQPHTADTKTLAQSHEWRSLNSPLAPTKRWKWGTGWIIIAYLFYSPRESKAYDSFGSAGHIAQFIGCFLSLALYFYLRQRVLRRIEKTWLRSVTAGLITYIFFLLLTLFAIVPFLGTVN